MTLPMSPASLKAAAAVHEAGARGLSAAFRVLIAPDKFKGSLTAEQAALAMARGTLRARPDALIDVNPVADGGEGTAAALVAATSGQWRSCEVTGPMGTPVIARFGLLGSVAGDGLRAVMEMASASGLTLVPQESRDVLRATTRGTGELLLAALDAGAQEIVIGIGGSATNDGGAGLAQALGYRLKNARGEELPPGGLALRDLHAIDPTFRDPRLDHVRIRVACDVDNPLCGPRGATAVYGPQKGVRPDQTELLDNALSHWADIVQRDLGVSVRDKPGAGAAGGLGGGLVACAGGVLQSGIDLVLEITDFSQKLEHAHLCLTGEGRLDGSTVHGKVIAGVARQAQRIHPPVPVLALAGGVSLGAEMMTPLGVNAYFSICPGPITLESAVGEAELLLERATEQAVRAFLAGWSRSKSKSDRDRVGHEESEG